MKRTTNKDNFQVARWYEKELNYSYTSLNTFKGKLFLSIRENEELNTIEVKNGNSDLCFKFDEKGTFKGIFNLEYNITIEGEKITYTNKKNGKKTSFHI